MNDQQHSYRPIQHAVRHLAMVAGACGASGYPLALLGLDNVVPTGFVWTSTHVLWGGFVAYAISYVANLASKERQVVDDKGADKLIS